MRGSIVKRSRTSWSLVIDDGRDPVTKRRKQKWIKYPYDHTKNVKANKALADKKLAEVLDSSNKGTYIDSTTVTLIDYLRDWLTKITPARRAETIRVYRTMVEVHVATAKIGGMLLQRIRASDLESLYASVDLAPSSVQLLHAILGRALKTATRDKAIASNPAKDATERPKVSKDAGQGARENVWTRDEARAVLTAAKETSPQVSAFLAVLLDTGVRKSEALGLRWRSVDLAAGTITISEQLAPRCEERPVWGPTKTGTTRVISLGAEAITRLRTHKQTQATLKLAHRTTYQDSGLVFAKEEGDLRTPGMALGTPCFALAGSTFTTVLRAAGVRPITPHGTRHTMASLLLSAGVPIQVVSARLGHAKVSQTLDTYAHCLAGSQQAAAGTIDAILAGR